MSPAVVQLNYSTQAAIIGGLSRGGALTVRSLLSFWRETAACVNTESSVAVGRPVLLVIVWWFLQVLRWHQTDGVSQRPGDELCSGRTVQGEHTSRFPKSSQISVVTPLSFFRTTQESSTIWWRCTSCTSTSTNTMTRWVLAFCCSFQQSRRSLPDFLVTRIKHSYIKSVIFLIVFAASKKPLLHFTSYIFLLKISEAVRWCRTVVMNPAHLRMTSSDIHRWVQPRKTTDMSPTWTVWKWLKRCEVSYWRCPPWRQKLVTLISP